MTFSPHPKLAGARLFVGIRTAPRATPTLLPTYNSVLNSRIGAHAGNYGHVFNAGPTIFAEQGTEIPSNLRERVLFNPGPAGSWFNLLHALTVATRVVGGGADPHDAIVLFEDDVAVSEKLAYRLWHDERFAELLCDRETGVVSLYTAGPQESQLAVNQFIAGGDGWHALDFSDGSTPLGSLAQIFPIQAARRIVRWARQTKTNGPADWMVGQICRDLSLNYWTHSPSFVKHVGEVSAIARDESLSPPPMEHRQARTFCENAEKRKCVKLQ